MSQFALTKNGTPVDADSYTSQSWEKLKAESSPGDFIMPCCNASAVLKTSINGLAFFAHSSDECATAPETIWHRTGKAAVVAAIQGLGVRAHEEVAGKSAKGAKWQADVLFEVAGRAIAIELQRSPQHFRDYIRRQERYADSCVECYWLTTREAFMTLQKSTVRELLKREYGGRMPKEGVKTGLLPDFSVAWLDLEETPTVLMGLGKQAVLQAWIMGIVNNQYRYDRGAWNLG
jgi:competence protein CoiA